MDAVTFGDGETNGDGVRLSTVQTCQVVSQGRLKNQGVHDLRRRCFGVCLNQVRDDRLLSGA